MDKTPNDKSIWQQSKGVFNDGTEIISETFEAGAELVRAVRKSLNLLNLQIDETIILQKISLVGVILQAGQAINMTEEEARRADEDAALGCAILGFIIIVTIVGCIIL